MFPVLIADIVFLQTRWKLFSLNMAWWLSRGDKQANYCTGCVEAMEAKGLAVEDTFSR